jgi:hypothetical protein
MKDSINKDLIKDWLLLQLSKDQFRFLFKYIQNEKMAQASQFNFNYHIKNNDQNAPIYIIYRISAKNNGKSPIFKQDKYRLTKFCLDSLIKTFAPFHAKYFFLLDSCPENYQKLIEGYKLIDKEIIKLSHAGNLGSYFAQLDLACQLPEPSYVYLAEDDYYYLPDAGEKLLEAL